MTKQQKVNNAKVMINQFMKGKVYLTPEGEQKLNEMINKLECVK